MLQDKVTCYKLCYAMGVSPEALAADFAAVNRVAEDTHYFDDKKCVNDYRAICRVHDVVLLWYNLYAEAFTLQSVAGTRFRSYTDNSSFDFEATWSRFDALAFLNVLASEANDRLYTVWEEMKLCLPFETVRLLMHKETLTPVSLKQVRFILQSGSPYSGIYFSGSPVFNYKSREFLQSGAALAERIGIACGKEPLSVADNSELYRSAMAFEEDRFMHLEDFARFKTIMCDCREDLWELKGSEGIDIKAVSSWAAVEFVVSKENGAGCLVLTESETRAISLAETYPEVTVLLEMPVRPKFYRKVKAHVYPNIYLRSSK